MKRVLELLPKTVTVRHRSSIKYLRRADWKTFNECSSRRRTGVARFLTAHFKLKTRLCILVDGRHEWPHSVRSPFPTWTFHGRASATTIICLVADRVTSSMSLNPVWTPSISPSESCRDGQEAVGGNRIDVLVIGIGIVFSDMERLVQGVADDTVGVGVVRMTHLRYAGADGDDVASFAASLTMFA